MSGMPRRGSVSALAPGSVPPFAAASAELVGILVASTSGCTDNLLALEKRAGENAGMKSRDHRSKQLARASMRPVRPMPTKRRGAALLAVICLSPTGVAAQIPTSTWIGTTSDFNTASNWNPPGVPLITRSAAFAGDGFTSVTGAMGVMPGIQFNGDKSYVIDISALGLTLNLTGIVNNSSVSQTIRSSAGGTFSSARGWWPIRTF